MIKRIAFYLLNNNELNTFAKRVVTLIKKHAKINVGTIAKIIILLETANEKLTNTLNTSFKTEHKDILKKLDKLRDNAFRALRDVIEGCTRRLNEDFNLHANKLKAIFETHGWTLYDDPYAVESSKLNSLIKDLETADSQASLQSLGYLDWFNELKGAQSNFEEAFQNKANDDSKKDFVATAEIRPEIIENLDELLRHIKTEAKHSENPEDYTEITNSINTIIEESFNPARARKTRRGNSGEEID